MSSFSDFLAPELAEFEKHFREAVKSRVGLLDRIMHYVVRRKGKQMRPMFVFLSARLAGPVTPATYRAASLVELLHTATLVHDDVVDEAMERRGFFSINALWKNKGAVLVGDYLLSKGLLLSLDNQDFRVLQILSRAVKNMSEAELLQMEKSRSLNLDENVYFDIIRGKTASLIASACEAGASTTFENEDQVLRMREFGEKTGIAFQLKDDLFDYGSSRIGKPTGNDIREKKLTLPVIRTLATCDPKLRKKIIYIIKNQNRDRDKVRFVTDQVRECGGIAYAEEKMYSIRDEAISILHGFPASGARDAMESLVRYTTDRAH